MDDAPLADGSWLLQHLGNRFQALHYVEDAGALDAATAKALGELAFKGIAVEPIVVAQGPGARRPQDLIDAKGRAAERYDLKPGTTYLARPDQHVAARWRQLDATKLQSALARATGNA
jgi:3-(3-hydroxy-phenyl)propionate hydroxylase